MDYIEFPEFIYGDVSISEYIEKVITEKRDIKDEIIALVDFIADIAKYPFEDGEQTFLYINACCKAIRGLMRYGNLTQEGLPLPPNHAEASKS